MEGLAVKGAMKAAAWFVSPSSTMFGVSANWMAWTTLPEASSAWSRKLVPGGGADGMLVVVNARHGRNWAVPALKSTAPRTSR